MAALLLALFCAPGFSYGLDLIPSRELGRFSETVRRYNECLEKEKKAIAEKSPETARLTEDRKIAAQSCEAAAEDALSGSGQEILRRQLESGEPLDNGKFYTTDGRHLREKQFFRELSQYNEYLEKEKNALGAKSPGAARLTEDRKIAAVICRRWAEDNLTRNGQEILRRQLDNGEPVDENLFRRHQKLRETCRIPCLSWEAEFEMISKLRRTKSGEFEISAPRVRPGDKISVKAGTIGGGKAAAQAKDSSVTDAKGAAELRAVRMLKDEYGAITYVTDPSPETALRIEPLDGKLKFISQKGEGGKDILVPSWSDIDSIVINGEEYRIKLELRFPGE